VRPRYQGAGIGGRLLEHAEREARERGADALWLGVMVKNTRALEWYKRIGFMFVEEAPFVMGASSADHLIGFRPLTS
ncbi:MAG: Histone acetyltransferase HPA2-like protein, partial [Bacteroidetes bacterium]|nr:Histone acetyltransferase HPA2-like protein [Bacteroidota bacterium]